VVPWESNLPVELPLPDEGLDQSEFKQALTAFLKYGFDGALAQSDGVVHPKFCKLQRKADNLKAMIHEEGERYARESSKLQNEIQALKERFCKGD
jgi:hypothetical protein